MFHVVGQSHQNFKYNNKLTVKYGFFLTSKRILKWQRICKPGIFGDRWQAITMLKRLDTDIAIDYQWHPVADANFTISWHWVSLGLKLCQILDDIVVFSQFPDTI
jgi:hypothetical protein